MEEDPRRYVRMMSYIRTRIDDGTFEQHELMPPIQELHDQTGFSRATIGKALRLLQDEGLVKRTPGLGYVPVKRRTAATNGRLGQLTTVNGNAGNTAWGQGGVAYGGH